MSSFSPRKFLLAISTATMVRMSTLVVLLRTSDRKLAFYAAIALKATELLDYYALTSDHVRLMAHACVPSSSIAPTSRRFQPQVH